MHASFLARLIRSATAGSKSKLSEPFLQFRERFLIYGEYIANLTRAQNLIEELSNKNDAIHVELEVRAYKSSPDFFD